MSEQDVERVRNRLEYAEIDENCLLQLNPTCSSTFLTSSSCGGGGGGGGGGSSGGRIILVKPCGTWWNTLQKTFVIRSSIF